VDSLPLFKGVVASIIHKSPDGASPMPMAGNSGSDIPARSVTPGIVAAPEEVAEELGAAVGPSRATT
jgi:hypothetical protein